MTRLFLCELSVLGAINFLNSFCETITWLVFSQTYLNFTDDKQIGKDCFSRKERKGRQDII
jgi:hypothetical protein